VSTTGQDSQTPLVGPAAVAEWRRRQAAQEATPDSPEGDDKRVNGFQSPGDEQRVNGFQSPGDEQRVNGFQLPGDEQRVNGFQSPGDEQRVNGFQLPGDEQRVNGFQLPGDEQRVNGLPPSGGIGTSDPPGVIARSFTESQQAGLTAIIHMAETDAPAPEITSAEPSVTPDRQPAAEAPEGQRRTLVSSSRGLALLSGLSLAVILTVQTVMSIRLVWSNTAYTDEALYLWAGRMEWAHWLHGAPIPAFPTYFSGAPVIYPPLGAIADSIDGLAGARILSLCFMLGATSLLWATTSRLFGRRAGFFAAGLWAFLGPTLKLGAFATFDAMSLFLLALAVWCGVRAGPRRDSTLWVFAAAGALALANATAYSTAIFDPVVIGVVLLAWWPLPTAKQAAMRAAYLGAYTIAALILLVTIAGSLYGVGISQTVLSRANGNNPASVVLSDATRWTAPVIVAAVAGLLICAIAERQRGRFAMLLVLVCAAFLVPFEQARIHTITSLDKHTDFGAWFMAITAGYAISKVCGLLPRAWARAAVCLVCAAALVFPVTAGWEQAQTLFNWANSTRFVAALRPLIQHDPGPLLIETPSPARYYLETSVPWQDWSSTWAITLPDGKSMGEQHGLGAAGQPAVYKRLLQHGYFSVVALNWAATPGFDQLITADLGSRYSYVASVPYGPNRYVIWRRTSKAASP
jgi:hypothetical protein